jgi:2-polyprenyl-3-methyl-5-hydroxy-6-metoxy-1,4-benzoquinol methylase
VDVGCGHGALVHFAREAGYADVTGVDGSREQVEAAAGLGIAGVSQGGVLETLDACEAGSVDVITAFDVLEHFSKEHIPTLVDAVLRALKPGGRWIIHVPNGDSPFFGSVYWGDLTHEVAFTRDSLAHLLLASGFSDVRSYEDRPVAHGLKSAVRAVLWTVVRGVLLTWIATETGVLDRGAVLSRNLLAVARK